MISPPLSTLCFSYICGKLYGSHVFLGLSYKWRCEHARDFQIAGTLAIARAVGLHRAWAPPKHTWEPSNMLLYSQGFLWNRYLAKSELCGIYCHVL